MTVETTTNPATEQMVKTVDGILDCYDYGSDGWDEELVKTVSRRSKRGGDWAKRWYLDQIKDDGGFNFDGIGVAFGFAEWAASYALKQVDWDVVGKRIVEKIFGNDGQQP
jgi:hypothetical protein